MSQASFFLWTKLFLEEFPPTHYVAIQMTIQVYFSHMTYYVIQITHMTIKLWT